MTFEKHFSVCAGCHCGYLKTRKNQGTKCKSCTAQAAWDSAQKRSGGPKVSEMGQRLARGKW